MPFVREIIFLGTGTSSCVPNVKCLVGPNRNECKVCLDAVQTIGSKNRRKNTSLLIRISESETEEDPARFRNVVIDTGKSFYESTLALFPKYNVSEIDAVILTHPHADAILGLDDLRAWSKSKLPVYLDAITMETISACFPYCVNTNLATGGGEVPTLNFQIFNENDVLSICGVDFIPLKVEHGEYSDGLPFYCYGYRFDNVVYISDCSKIPASTVEKMEGSDIIILDALRPEPHKSHFSLLECMQTLDRFQPSLGLMTGFTHQFTHEELTGIASNFMDTGKMVLPLTKTSKDYSKATMNGIGSTEDVTSNGHMKKLVPAYDGMRILLPLSVASLAED